MVAPVFERDNNKDPLRGLLDKKKGLICKEFEKVCPTDSSFHRMVKEMHNIFDDLYSEIAELDKQ